MRVRSNGDYGGALSLLRVLDIGNVRESMTLTISTSTRMLSALALQCVPVNLAALMPIQNNIDYAFYHSNVVKSCSTLVAIHNDWAKDCWQLLHLLNRL